MTLAETVRLALSAQRNLLAISGTERLLRQSAGGLTPQASKGFAASRAVERARLADCAKSFAALEPANDAAFNDCTVTDLA